MRKLFLNSKDRVKGYRLMALFLLLPVFVSAQQYSVDDVLNRIEQNNPALKAYKNRASADLEHAKVARAWMPPKAGAELDMFPYNFDYTQANLQFSIMQDFPSLKKNMAKENYYKSIADIENYSGESKKWELFTNAKEAYHMLYIARLKIGILNEGADLLKLMIDLATKQMAITKGDLGSVYRLKARLVENQTMVVHEGNVIRAELVKLNYLMNEDIDHVFEIDTNGLIKNYRSLNSRLKVDSLDCKRSDIKRMGSEINTMKLNRQYVALQSRPEYGMKLQHYQQLGTMPNAFSVMGTMTIPSAPWSARGYKSELREIDFQLAAMQNDRTNMVNMAMQMIKMNLVELESEYAELDNYSQHVVPTYRKSLDANLLSYGQNTNDMNMALLAWDDLLNAQLEYLKHMDTYLKIQRDYEKEIQSR